jgi:hypothetical protein
MTAADIGLVVMRKTDAGRTSVLFETEGPFSCDFETASYEFETYLRKCFETEGAFYKRSETPVSDLRRWTGLRSNYAHRPDVFTSGLDVYHSD